MQAALWNRSATYHNQSMVDEARPGQAGTWSCSAHHADGCCEVLHKLAGAFLGNALLHRWKLRASWSCDLCACPTEMQAHIQSVCPALKREASIAAHHHLAGTIFDFISSAGHGWRKYRELTSWPAGPTCATALNDRLVVWYHMCDELTDDDLETAT
jgi:hypothetical protein